jgi:RNA polymerase sigma-70 factor (ECF subfamily)
VTDQLDARGDDFLLAAARQGDAEALEALIRRYQPRVYRFGVSMCRNPEDASDIVQETLLAMARNVGNFRGDSTVASWLYTIARRFCIRKRRRGRHAPAREESLEALGSNGPRHLSDPGPGPEQAAASREIQEALAAAIGTLDGRQREVLLLRDVEGLSAPEVAAVLGVGVPAVKSRLHRARLAVRQQIAPLLGVPGAAAAPSEECPDVVMLLSRHLEGDIAPDVCAKMEAHLERCDRCKGRCETLRRTLAFCRSTPAPEVPPPVAESVRQAIRTFLDTRASPRPTRTHGG